MPSQRVRKSYQQIAPAIEPLISRGSVLCTDGNQSYIQIAEDAGVIHKRLIISNKKRVEDEVYHILYSGSEEVREIGPSGSHGCCYSEDRQMALYR